MALVLNDLPRWISVVGLFSADVFVVFFYILKTYIVILTNVPNYKKNTQTESVITNSITYLLFTV